MTAEQYAKESIKTLKASEVNPFDEIKALAKANDLSCCRGSYCAWGVLHLMLMVDYYKRKEK